MHGWRNGLHNTILKTNAAILFDRLLRALIERTLPRRNLSTVRFHLPVDPAERRARFALELPGGAEEPLAVDALGGDAYGVSLRELPARGIYRLTARQVEEPKPGEPAGKLWESPLAVNGPAEESNLRPLTGTDLDARLAGTSYRWTGPSEAIALEGARIQGQSFWRWLLLGALACLLAEIAILAWPAIRGIRSIRQPK